MKTVLVTGACINTGVAIVEKFAGEGRNIVFTGRNAETVQIKEKEYVQKFVNENSNILAVAICYDSKKKEHHCKIEKLK